MAKPQNRSELIDYCLRRLGFPVIEINVAEEQLEDRIDEALELFFEQHYAATTRGYYAHQLTAADVENGYITLPEDIICVVELLSIRGSSNSNQFTDTYHLELSAFESLRNGSGSLLDYTLTKQKIAQLNNTLNPPKLTSFNIHTNRLHIFTEKEELLEGAFMVLDVYTAVDGEIFTSLWDNRWLKLYCTALIKYQWGSNLSKYDQVQLLNGVTMRGNEILADAKEEIKELEELLETKYSDPLGDIFIG